MEAVVHTDVGEFAELTRERFAKDPVWHTVAVSVLYRLRNLPQPDEPQSTMVSLHQGDELVGSLFRHPRWSLQVADLPLAEVDLAVELLRRVDPDLPGGHRPE